MRLSTLWMALASLAVSGYGLEERQVGAPVSYPPITVNIYSDGDCQDLLATETVGFSTCFTGSSVGWSSMMITGDDGIDGGTLTAYTKNNCGCPTCGSHGYDVYANLCLKDFGFVANAMGY